MILKNISIDKLVFKGLGLGSYLGKKIFIPFSYPGDNLDAEIISEKKDYIKALPIKLNKATFTRIDTKCPVFKQCGGCNSLDIEYSQQCILKKEVIQDIFPSYKSLIQDTVASPEQYHYRNKVFFPVSTIQGKISFGMYKNLSHKVVKVEQCQLVDPEVLIIAQALCDHLNLVGEKAYDEKTNSGNIRHIGLRINIDNEVMLIVVTNKSKLAFTNQLVEALTSKFPNITSIIQNINKSNSNTILGNSDKILYGNGFFIDRIDDKQFKIHYQSFFQINRLLTQNIYRQIRNDIPQNSNVLDAYSGVSTIGIFIHSKANKVLSVESNKWATQDAVFNVNLNKCENVKVINAKLEDEFKTLIKLNDIDTIVFDPPRKGLESNIRDLIKDSSISRIIYLSCNPTTQKRDVDDFVNAGFKIKYLVPYDMFPNTYHIENYILLTR